MSKTYFNKKIFTIPNLITTFRFGVLFILFWVWFTENLFTDERIRISIVVFLFILGSLSDYLDGYIARMYDVKSEVGAFMDSMVDKIFILSFFIAFLYIDLIDIWWGWVAMIMIREVVVTWLRIRATIKKQVLVTEKHGKAKMLIQIIYNSLIVLYFVFYAVTYEFSAFKEYLNEVGYSGKPLLEIPIWVYDGFYQTLGIPVLVLDCLWYLPNILLAGVAVFTVYSGVNYILKSRYTREA